ncbi:hypothetical protein HWV62_28491 [Athelia sp. TMB]|nr:hypothetical protein HWV62_28491 [Athelia sp. TMB]
MTLPPITSFVTPMLKVTPPRSQDRRTSSSRLPPIDDSFLHTHTYDLESDSESDEQDENMEPQLEMESSGTSTMDDAFPEPQPQSLNDAHAPHFVDWLDNTLKRPVSFVAEKTCEMICYLWFATSLPSPPPQSTHSSHSPPYTPARTKATALQLAASPAFIAFLQKVLETTQVGQSVIVLSLHYIYLLKARNRLAAAQAGSEFRIAVAALMMANKFLDDNTYTNRTWSDVSGIGLEEVNRMEREFLEGVGWACFVDGATYGKWRDLLRGLVAAKERDRKMWRGPVRSARSSGRLGVNTTPSRNFSARHGRAQQPHRARSTSPSRFTYAFEFTAPHSHSPPQPLPHSATSSYPPHSTYSSNPSYPPHAYTHQEYPEYSPTPDPRPGSKRHATDAFSPTASSFADLRPTKAQKPTPSSLVIPEHPQTHAHPQRSSPLEGLQGFATMSLASSNGAPYTPETRSSSPAPGPTWNGTREAQPPQTLVAAYRAGGPVQVPQNLYYYSLAGSAHEEEEENNRRKAKLRRHQPPPAYPAFYPPQRVPQNVQSASASPVHGSHAHSHHTHYSAHGQHLEPPTQYQAQTATLPHFHDTVWTREPAHGQYAQSSTQSPVPSAPFANAGPPGFHGQFYTPPQQVLQQPSPLEGYWARGRRL